MIIMLFPRLILTMMAVAMVALFIWQTVYPLRRQVWENEQWTCFDWAMETIDILPVCKKQKTWSKWAQQWVYRRRKMLKQYRTRSNVTPPFSTDGSWRKTQYNNNNNNNSDIRQLSWLGQLNYLMMDKVIPYGLSLLSLYIYIYSTTSTSTEPSSSFAWTTSEKIGGKVAWLVADD